jgi:hypothetical protein
MKYASPPAAISLSLWLASLLLSSACLLAQDKDTLDTKVVAEGNTITLSWNKKHPWDADLIAHGVSLFAEYKTKSNGVVAERLQAAGPSGANNRFIHFRLPDALIAAPQGAVCLYFQLPNRKLLPVRRADPQILDTARMRYEPWETVAVRNSQEKSHDAQLAALESAIDQRSAEIGAAENALNTKGWTSAASCQALPRPQFVSGQRPFDVVDPAQQEDVARRVCISRIRYADEYIDELFRVRFKDAPATKKEAVFHELALSWVMLSPDELASILQLSRQDASNPDIRQRQEQLREFRTDWAHWAPSAESYTPQLGGKTDLDFLTFQTFLEESCKADKQSCDRLVYLIASHLRNPANLSSQPPPPSTFILGYAGGALEAYSRCVVDDQKELKTKYDAWQQLQKDAPALAEQAHNELVASCQRQFTALDQLRADKDSLEAQYRAASGPQVTTPNDVSAAPQNLNASLCQHPH